MKGFYQKSSIYSGQHVEQKSRWHSLNVAPSSEGRLAAAEMKGVEQLMLQTEALTKLLGLEKDVDRKKALFKNYICNKRIWVMDATIIGKKYVVLTIHEHGSLNIKSYIIKEIGSIKKLNLKNILLGLTSVCSENNASPFFVSHYYPLYDSEELNNFIRDYMSSYLSSSAFRKLGNQVCGESFTNNLKRHVVTKFFKKLTTDEKAAFSKLLDPTQKKLNYTKRAFNKRIQEIVFGSCFFEDVALVVLKEVLMEFNSKLHQIKYSCDQREILVGSFEPAAEKTFYRETSLVPLVETEDSPPSEATKQSKSSSENVANDSSELANILIGSIEPAAEKSLLNKETSLVLPSTKPNTRVLEESQKLLKTWATFKEAVRRDDQVEIMYFGFSLTIAQNQAMLQNQKRFEEKLTKQTNTIKRLQAELQEERNKQAEKAAQRLKYRNRTKREVMQPILLVHFTEAIKLIGPELNPLAARLRLAITLLFLTGARVNEIRKVEIKTVSNLFEKQRPYIEIVRQKGGTRAKTFVSKYGSEILKNRRQDYEILKSVLKEGGIYLFQSRKEDKPISREHFTKSINKVLKKLGAQFDMHFTTHAFRRGWITQLWKDTQNIELVRQAIGHKDLKTTSIYTGMLSDTEKENIFKNLYDIYQKEQGQEQKAHSVRKLKRNSYTDSDSASDSTSDSASDSASD